jgi:hypothetical protein
LFACLFVLLFVLLLLHLSVHFFFPFSFSHSSFLVSHCRFTLVTPVWSKVNWMHVFIFTATQATNLSFATPFLRKKWLTGLSDIIWNTCVVEKCHFR